MQAERFTFAQVETRLEVTHDAFLEQEDQRGQEQTLCPNDSCSDFAVGHMFWWWWWRSSCRAVAIGFVGVLVTEVAPS